jgi:hypothetical protein
MLDVLVAVSAGMGRARTLLVQAERAHENARRKADTYPALREARKNLAEAEAIVERTKKLVKLERP